MNREAVLFQDSSFTFQDFMPNNIYNNLGDKELKASYWYITHKVLLRRVGIIVLAVVAGVLILYGFWGLLDHFVIERKVNLTVEEGLIQDKLNFALLEEANNPKDLVILETEVLVGSEGHYDFVSIVVNPNTQWVLESFDYYYQSGEIKTDLKSDFILPEQTKYVLFQNYESEKPIRSVDLRLENLKWKKVSDFQSLRDKTMQFDFQNKILLTSKKSGLSEKDPVSVLSFDVINKSPYNYWEPKFVALLYRGNSLAGVVATVLDGLNAGEQKTETVNIFQDIPQATKIEIFPDINILEPNVFRGFDNGVGELK